MKTQLEILENMQQSGFNVVLCCNCGCTLLHETENRSIWCPYCNRESDSSQFPDYHEQGTTEYFKELEKIEARSKC